MKRSPALALRRPRLRLRVLINITITLLFRFVVVWHIGIRVAVTDVMMDYMTLSGVVAKSSCDA
jgi:hypothetical protein